MSRVLHKPWLKSALMGYPQGEVPKDSLYPVCAACFKVWVLRVWHITGVPLLKCARLERSTICSIIARSS